MPFHALQTRSVNCIQEVRHGSGNVLKVDDAFCPQPPPITQQFCNVVDCSPKWSVTPWEKVGHFFLFPLHPVKA